MTEPTVGLLRDAGRLHGEPDEWYREWVRWTLASGLTPEQVVDVAREEGVTAATFAPLAGRTVWRGPDGRPYVLVDDARRARELARLTELVNGGRPNRADARRDRNRWSYTGLLGMNRGDAGVAVKRGALVATPEGTMLAAAGGRALRAVPNPVDWFAARGGTTWGEIYLVNGSFDDPAEVLRTTVEAGRRPPGSGAPSLARLLRHERVHSEQWARYGYARFIWKYVVRHNPRKPCEHPLEREAGLADAGYRC
ncbi:hypothetical protein E1262_04030 [Jiangella aurantiaca]|uniref:Uncharacterized protein n=1 Tax=Jiangella aurantiaca TaxID=2530373 RepID=A0A4R5AJG9_9ACTN|nr:hypothetical protein [Jiangella aurantiaca]TDD71905.1 hypothetical protein E1262_04030 [Jiangella aurantiaca]